MPVRIIPQGCRDGKGVRGYSPTVSLSQHFRGAVATAVTLSHYDTVLWVLSGALVDSMMGEGGGTRFPCRPLGFRSLFHLQPGCRGRLRPGKLPGMQENLAVCEATVPAFLECHGDEAHYPSQSVPIWLAERRAWWYDC